MDVKFNKLTGLYALLILSIGNASLRLTDGGMSSFFRILAPLFVIAICFNYRTKLFKSLIVVLGGILYSVAVSLIGYGTVMFEYIIFAIYIYAVFVIMFCIRETVDDFELNFWNFLHITTSIVLILAVIQFFVRIPYPFVTLPVKRGINLFMSNENEMALPLGMMSFIYLYKMLFNKKKKYLLHFALILVIIFINDAKLTLIGCILGYVVLLFYYMTKKIKFSPTLIILSVLGVLTLGIAFLYIFNPTVTFRDYSINMTDLIFSAVESIVKLEPLPGSGGSLVDRTNAIIYGVRELIKSGFLGIGWGNSVTMLSMSEYQLMTAKSMHNIFFQFLCEMGIFAIVVYWLFVKALLRNNKNIYKDTNCILKNTFIIAFIIVSAQSSIGILSNYYMWIIVFYVALLPSKNTKRKKKESLKENEQFCQVVKGENCG